MAVSKRTGATLLAVVALGLSVTGVVLAATDSNPGGSSKDPLVLNGYPPRSANILLTVSTGQPYKLSANVNMDFTTNRVDATVQFPLVFTMASVDLRLVDKHLYVGSAAASSGSWFSLPMKQPALFGLALEMTKPDIALISGFSHETKTKSGYITTYDFTRDNVAVSNPLGTTTASIAVGSLDWSISTGSQGEVTQSTITVRSGHRTTTISAVVLSYNHSGHISAPPADKVHPFDKSLIKKLLGSASISSILLPQNLSSLGQMHLN
jgi:hypothetical protein